VADESSKSAAVAATTIPEVTGTGYPEPYRAAVKGRHRRALGDAFGLTHFGVNLVRLEPGAASSQRHWHTREDELVYVLEGEPTLVTDAGEQVLGPGMVAGFKAGAPNGHHLVNRTARDVLFIVVGDRDEGDECEYPDIDMAARVFAGTHRFVRKDGTPY
jgi:uncharacterized cupin superfamily protein